MVIIGKPLWYNRNKTLPMLLQGNGRRQSGHGNSASSHRGLFSDHSTPYALYSFHNWKHFERFHSQVAKVKGYGSRVENFG